MQYVSISFILIDKYKFLSLITIEKYIDILKHGDKQFSAKQQVLEFYVTYTGTISKQKSLFIDKVKKQDLWKTTGYIKKDW